MWLREKYIIFRYKLGRKLSSLHAWGRQRFSFLIVPHSEKMVLKIRLSNYLLVFLTFLAVSLTALAIFSRLFRDPELAAMDKLVRSSNEREVLKMALKLQIRNLNQIMGQLDETVDGMGRLIWENDYQPSRDWRQDLPLPGEELTLAAGNLSLELAEVRRLRQRAENFFDYFNNSAALLNRRMAIYLKSPMGRPLPDGLGYNTSSYGYRENAFGYKTQEFHRGQDLATYRNAPIYSTADGTVVYVNLSPSNNLGIHTIIEHAYGFRTLYAHCSGVVVWQGQKIKKNDLIGYVGTTGRSTGPHLHYEVHIGNAVNHQDPRPFLNPLD